MFKKRLEGCSYTSQESQEHYQEHASHLWHEQMSRKVCWHGSIKQQRHLQD